ncbi:MAG: hypothetical protein QXP46_06405, partial [Archaeoglobaceae archaeon]
MISEKIELDKILPMIRREIETSEVAKKISELDSKLVELRKAVEGIVIELTYIKSELKELRENSKDRKSVQTQLKDEKTSEKLEKHTRQEEIKVDTFKREKIGEKENENSKKSQILEDEKDLIICD